MSKEQLIAKHKDMIAKADALPFGTEKGRLYQEASRLSGRILAACNGGYDPDGSRADIRANGGYTTAALS